jgi:stage IV sporulation protein FB
MNGQKQPGFRIFSIGGTPIHLEISFFIIVAFFVFMAMERGAPIQNALLWVPILFISVVVHELGHAGMLSALGFGSSHISLAGFGGYTYNPRRARPWQDLLVSLAGPVMSFVLGGVCWFLLRNVEFIRGDLMLAPFFQMMTIANIFWGFFNLVPIFPLDGGHVLRNFLLLFLRPQVGFMISVWLSIILAVAVALIGITLMQILMTIIAVMLLIQNFQRWKAYREAGSLD